MQSGRAISGVHLSLVGFTSDRAHAQPVDVPFRTVDTPMPAQALTPQTVMVTAFAAVGVVPDGVTRVKGKLINVGQNSPIAVYPRVHGNVAIAPWTPRSTGLGYEHLLAGATWYGPDGHVIAGFSELAQIHKQYGH